MVASALAWQQVIAPKRDYTEPHHGEPLSGQDRAARRLNLAIFSPIKRRAHPEKATFLVTLRYSLGDALAQLWCKLGEAQYAS